MKDRQNSEQQIASLGNELIFSTESTKNNQALPTSELKEIATQPNTVEVRHTVHNTPLEVLGTNIVFKIAKFLRRASRLPISIRHNLLNLLRLTVRRCFELGLRLAKRNPRFMLRVRYITAHFPWVEARLRTIAQAGIQPNNVHRIQWMVQPDAAVVLSWRALLGSKSEQHS